jgi:hypothetical protein
MSTPGKDNKTFLIINPNGRKRLLAKVTKGEGRHAKGIPKGGKQEARS